MQPLIVVPANDVDAAGMDLVVDLPQDWLDAKLTDAEARSRRPGHLKARISRSGKTDIVVRAHVVASLDLPCARCLGASLSDVDTNLSLLLKARPNGPQDEGGARARGPRAGARSTNGTKPAPARKDKRSSEYEFSSGEADLDEYDGEKVVLDDFIREAILLELPSFPLCSETCEGGGRTAEASQEAPRDEVATPPGKSPFAALRHLLTGEALPPEETAGNRSPTPSDIRRINRAKNRGKPKIRSSALQRGKK